jgi:predicted GNAT family acetyltransferase
MPITFARSFAVLPAQIDGFLSERVERNVQASLVVQGRTGARADSPPLFAWGTGEDGALRFFAMRTPPWPLLVSELSANDADALMNRWLAEDPDVPGVSGVPQTARAIAAAWERRTGGDVSCRMHDAMHVLSAVIEPPQPPAGALRKARAEDREVLVTWECAFVYEAGVIAAAAAEAERTVARRLESGAQFVWDDGMPVSTLALSPLIAGTVRIGPVYTPPEHRRRGYASAAVARASREALARGASQCMLFTDLANATSNKIYAAVGFRRIAEWEEFAFSR